MRSPLKHPLANGVAALLCVFLVLFPKGGLRVGNIPVTWGYVLIFSSSILLIPYRFMSLKAFYVRRQLIALLCLLPFAILFFYTYFAFGAPDLGGFLSTGISLIYLPLIFLVFFPPMLDVVDGRRLMKVFCFCVLAAAIFGLFLFIWRPVTGHWIQIPYLTVNADDRSDFENTKSIARGFVYKLISTYNNGNLYGAATIIVMRLFDLFSPQRWKRWILRLALALTLSRTIWAALVFDQFLSYAAILFEQRHHFPVVKLTRIWKGLLVLAAAVPCLLLLLTLARFGDRGGFLVDPTLGGRTSQFAGLGDATWFPEQASSFFFSEIVYLSAINGYGYTGFLAITIVLLSPIIVLLCDLTALDNPIRRAAFKGLLLYAMICTSDGALDLIPVMAFYWFTYMVFLFGLPRMEGFRSVSTFRPTRFEIVAPSGAAQHTA